MTFTPTSGPYANTQLTTDLYSFQDELVQSVDIGSQSGGAGAGKVIFNPAEMTIPVGHTSIKLMDNVESGSPISSVKIVLFDHNSTTPVETLEFRLVLVKDLTTTNVPT